MCPEQWTSAYPQLRTIFRDGLRLAALRQRVRIIHVSDLGVCTADPRREPNLEPIRTATGRDAGPSHRLLVVGEQPEGRMRGERADRAEITAIQREHRRRAVLGGQGHVDAVGQVEVKTAVLALDLPRGLEQLDGDLRDLESPAPRLEDNEIDQGRPCVTANRALARWSTSVNTRGETSVVPASASAAWQSADSGAFLSEAAMSPDVSATRITADRCRGRPPG
jgi:hypothetical protein